MSQSVRHAAVASVKKHFKFDAAETAALADETVVAEEMADLAPGAEEASDLSSDDEAPEEEGLEVVRAAARSSESARAIAVKQAREQERARRAQKHQRYAEQQEHKRQQEEELRASENGPVDSEAEVEELPEEFFDELEELPKPIETRPTKINFNDVGEQYAEPLRAELKKQKKKTLKSLRKQTLKRGPVVVSVLSPLGSRSAQPPKKESAVLNVKDKWLRRSALKRK
ncbi:ADR228Wp [Eremothecium gossypii ATCC 10895]|uniref:ADR228Wp n=1 Tax=Eremothecium gossypii (strain ATCC 10895 / CBS 109.51 / FGSC 9923 / NRRL Y-1056) TaxID=284811 RepID=Q759P5_EREGS|nr:ADR228Wp [Eremothecium gossypii ATCC 10895]AAS52148.2 ADR228Wp [Eremothecium gossypii ATCC 10895]AEY96447.1 FADR228Wp [Eremothecium gossypii FDAG1]